MPFIDTHAHLDDEKYFGQVDEIIERAKNQCVLKIINVGADMKSSRDAILLAEKYDIIVAGFGVHPQEASTVNNSDYYEIAKAMEHPQVKVLGEIGLDYYYENSPRELQKEVFIRQLDIARQMHMPVSIHDRDAHGDMMSILKKEAIGIEGSIHCFSGSVEMAKELVKMGWHLGIDGPLTFKNSAKLPEVVSEIPIEYLLLETDSPYLAPVPMRGKRNEPSYLNFIAEKIAQIKGIDIEYVGEITTSNAKKLFRL